MKKSKIILIGIGLLLVVLMALYLPLIIRFIKTATAPIQLGNENFKYYEKIKGINNSSIINLDDIFEFKWDRAYIVSNQEFSTEELTNIMGINYNLPAIEREYPVLRVIFIYEDTLVYDFLYDCRYIKFLPLDKIIYSDNAKFEKTEKNNLITLNSMN